MIFWGFLGFPISQIRMIHIPERSATADLGNAVEILLRRGVCRCPLDRERIPRIVPGRLAVSQNPIERLAAASDWSGLDRVDLVVEAVIEEMGAKRELFAKLDRATKPDAVLATNTSSLSVTQIAESTSNPRRVVGLHFFNPVPRMPLVEVVKTKHTDPRALATAVAVARYMAEMLFGVPPHDAWILTFAATVLIAMGAAVNWPIARRAARMDPVSALRAAE